ncbi:hypothetical protein FT663_01461 [Candidozyma haemuli var. vulneris]|uniref:VASt domain-containing protein n=1 Tax=Candidozyma haemuli TaxID=45357 RepID=A0A2V1AMZ0_9ASCO|nr:hypothetical protein CXQ85_003486 [[Candida] haemuloni]KAF3991612.1 hypothetical protein FT662_01610 [[Candida] haemuloni var. vulneris]KAF3994442.1 hypothetical protein FT663_01461 [[Candida] haemuloni var. vulneris]PVH19637.1 hypothetical protein CXQ85_003486 [[Candida] haemuloni]
MDEEDDAWSYSFPPSTELLPLSGDDNDDGSGQDSSNGSVRNGTKTGLAQPMPKQRGELSKISTSAKGDSVSFRSASVGSPGPSSASIGNTRGSGFMPKTVPADPHTTKKDASSIMSKEGSTNALAQAPNGTEGSASPPLTPKTDLSNSVKIWQKQQEQDSQSTQLSEMAAAAAAENAAGGDFAVSPKIIAYRKNHKKTLSEGLGPAFIDQQNELEREKFDPKLYVADKFKDTQYRYATMKRNVDFHQLFRSLDLTDRLLDDFACALSREILLQGRLYVTEHSLCFNSNLLGWVTSLIVPFEDIQRIDKKSTAGLFPNGISIETKDAKHNFASFLSRESTYEFLRTVWSASTGKEIAELDSSPPLPANKIKVGPSSSTDGKIDSYIHSIDGDDVPEVRGKSSGEFGEEQFSSEESDESEEESESDYSNSEAQLDSPHTEQSIDDASLHDSETVPTKIQRLKPDSSYKNMGPETHHPTTVSKKFEDDENECEICSATIAAPMGTVFDIMFGSNDTSFHSKFLETHDASEITKYDDYHPMEDDPTRLERKYVYKRALGYSIGPKSTRCIVSEIIEHLNFADYVVLLSVTSTPDVPSGGAFTVRTRYYFTWGEANTTRVKIAYYVKWTGSSWIKKMVENSTQSAQAAAAKDLVEVLNKEITEHTFSASGPPALKTEVEAAEQEEQLPAAPKAVKQKKKKEKVVSFSFSSPLGIISVIGGVLLSMLLFVQFKLMADLRESRALMNRQLALTTNLLGSLNTRDLKHIQSNAKNEAFWDFISKYEGRTFSKDERASYLAAQALRLLGDDEKKSSKKIWGLF